MKTAYDREASVAAAFARVAAAIPEAPAVVSADRTVCYGELSVHVNRLANHLAQRGVGPRATVGVAFERSPELPVALLAILTCGAAYVPLDLSYPPERLAFMATDAGLAAVVTEGGGELPAAFDTLLRIDVVRDAVAIANESDQCEAPAASALDRAYVTYTSGSTGRPKGVAVSQRGVLRLVRDVDYVDIEPRDTFLSYAPLAFDASTFEIWAPLLNGARLAIPPRGPLAVAELAAAIERFDVTTMFLTTAVFERVADSGLTGFTGLRHVLTGGEVASANHMRRFLERYPRTRLSAVYGPTENTTFSTWCDLRDAAAVGENVPIGRPVAHSTAYVLNEALRVAPPGVEGELFVGGDGVALGYVNLAELTASRFIPDRFSRDPQARLYKTGDRARRRRDGLFEFLGRTDDQVKVAGHRIELGEIEVALRAVAGVTAAAVTVCAGDGGKSLVAIVAAEHGVPLREDGLRGELAARLPRYMLPHRLFSVERLPETKSGKVDRAAVAGLATRLLAAPAAPLLPDPDAPARPPDRYGELQAAVASCWSYALGSEVPDVDTNFFDAGGDSLRMLSLHERLRSHVPIELTLVDLFEQTTIRKLTDFLAVRA